MHNRATMVIKDRDGAVIPQKAAHAVLAAMGRLGGLKRARVLSAEEQAAIGRRAAAARWRKAAQSDHVATPHAGRST